ncbi:MAG: cobalamin-dependent protein, partial [Arcobacteraceae bacterium]|nr:cobalamin-dependent protein [Arcobacteraceae bacterium]
MSDIILTTLNGRYTHSSLGLRYLFANLKDLQKKALIKEYVINEKMQDIAEDILKENPKIIGIGVYIWNASDVGELIEILKKVSPQTTIILGGPEVSYLPFRVNMDKADYIIQGEGEIPFYELCRDILEKKEIEKRIFPPKLYDLKEIELPYKYYDDNDIKNRYIYVEASRGCPFSCEFCLSSIDKNVRNFELNELLEEFQTLWDKGVRNFKFIDRTF